MLNVKKHVDVRAGWLLDGTGDSVKRDVLIRVADDTIDSVTPVSDNFSPCEGILDYSDCTILPD
jgi:hypothetical protein